ncbi:hypothetical protein, partial [Blautia wexlerae]
FFHTMPYLSAYLHESLDFFKVGIFRLMNNIKASAEEMVLKLLKSTLFVKLPAIRFHILTSFLVGKLVVLPPFRGAIRRF